MAFLNKFLTWACFSCLVVIITLSPWLFAAWEMWFFWPFAALISFSLFFFSLGLLLPGSARQEAGGRDVAESRMDSGMPADLAAVVTGEKGRNLNEHRSIGKRGGEGIEKRLLAFLILSYGIFIAYAFVRFLNADVFMDAERSFLLFLTPFLVAVPIVFGFDKHKLNVLYWFVITNLIFLGFYGIVNHVGWRSTHVLWVSGYKQYMEEVRATGSYFCPDHFSGIMELLICLSLGLLLARGTLGREKIFGLLGVFIGLVGVVLSKSRGGGLVVLAVFAAVMVIGFLQWPVAIRWYWRMIAGGLAVIVLILFCLYGTSYMGRFREHFGWSELRGKPANEIVSGVKARLIASCRGQMYSAAFRAWKTAPMFGIGPGMHQNLWPHFAPSPDGDRELGVWPTFPNNDFHSYEVHSDWIQLLEEYGVVGLALFLMPVTAVVLLLIYGIRKEVVHRKRIDWEETGNDCYAALLGGLLSLLAMGVHSLGDFNLQMPATVWLLAVIISIPVAYLSVKGSEKP